MYCCLERGLLYVLFSICICDKSHVGRTERERGRRLLCVSNIKAPVNNTHSRSARTGSGSEPREDQTSDTSISIKNGSLEFINMMIQPPQPVEGNAHHAPQAFILHNYSINCLLLLGYNILFFFFYEHKRKDQSLCFSLCELVLISFILLAPPTTSTTPIGLSPWIPTSAPTFASSKHQSWRRATQQTFPSTKRQRASCFHGNCLD